MAQPRKWHYTQHWGARNSLAASAKTQKLTKNSFLKTKKTTPLWCPLKELQMLTETLTQKLLGEMMNTKRPASVWKPSGPGSSKDD